MKLSTLIIATASLLIISTASFAQTGFVNLNNIENNTVTTAASIKFNPIGIANGVVKVKMLNQPKGTYTVQAIDEAGNVIGVKEIQYAGGSNTEIADFGKTFAGGTYQVAVISPDNNKTSETIMLLI